MTTVPLDLAATLAPRVASHPQRDASLERLVFFSDAVFAIAITLLALDLRPPDGEALAGSQLLAAVFASWPRVASYAITFVLIGSIWIAHVRMLRVIVRCDAPLLWLNLLLLGCVGLVPFHTALLGGHFGDRDAVLFYALGMTLARLAASGVWWYAAAGRRLLDPALPTGVVASITRRSVLTLAVSLLGVVSALFDPTVPKVVLVLGAAIPLVGWRAIRPSSSRR